MPQCLAALAEKGLTLMTTSSVIRADREFNCTCQLFGDAGEVRKRSREKSSTLHSGASYAGHSTVRTSVIVESSWRARIGEGTPARRTLGVGLLLLGCAAGAPFLPKLAQLAKGNLPFGVGAMFLLMVITVAYLPIRGRSRLLVTFPVLLPRLTCGTLRRGQQRVRHYRSPILRCTA
jgi:hypothetical protein